jgi:hypothetical protein
MIKLLMNNPMFGQAMQSGGQGGAGADPDMDSADMNRLADKISRQLTGGLATDPQSEQVVVPDTFAWKWKFLRIVSIVTVLGYLASQLEDYHFARNPDITDGLV